MVEFAIGFIFQWRPGPHTLCSFSPAIPRRPQLTPSDFMRTRFAPSPTGYLHIGGVRTALFNWLLSKQSGGQFVLRIDDTDQMRNVDEALQPILDGFKWLGMDWDEGPEVGGPHQPYFQSQRTDAHRAAAMQLVASGHAYRDYATADDLKELREAAEKSGERFFYDRRFMAADDDAAATYEAEGRAATIRLKMPRQGECVIDDLVRGEVRVPWDNEQDHVILRADGSPIYHLASAVDDHDLGITHIVRAEEHLSNTPRQIFILQSLGHELPQFAHLPYVAEPGGTAKLSKRKLSKYEQNKGFANLLQRGRAIAARRGIQTAAETFNPVIIDFYREIGFEPEAILNYLVLLGWSLDGETETFKVDEMIQKFSLRRVNKSPASFDPQKLLSFQADYFAKLSLQERIARVAPFAADANWIDGDEADDRLGEVVRLADDRIKIAGDIYDFDYCFCDEFEFNQKAFQKRLVKPEGVEAHLRGLADAFADGGAESAEAAETTVKSYCQSAGIELGEVIHALRVAVTGQPGGFGLFDTLAFLGHTKVNSRILAAIEQLQKTKA